MAVADSIEEGRVAMLRALLQSVTEKFDATDDPRNSKALSVEIREILAELDALAPKQVEKPSTSLDEVRKRREARLKKSG